MAMRFGPTEYRCTSTCSVPINERLTYHALRHTHASQLIDAGLPITVISKRLGHSSPAITLSIYAHCFQDDDRAASAAIDAALKG
jgi:integrase